MAEEMGGDMNIELVSVFRSDSFRHRRASDAVEQALDAADRQAQSMPLRYSHEEVFGSVGKMLTNGAPARTV